MAAATKHLNGPLWRVVFSTRRSNRSVCDGGPWHDQRGRVEGWVEWFKFHGHDAYLQASNGDIYDGSKLVSKAGAR